MKDLYSCKKCGFISTRADQFKKAKWRGLCLDCNERAKQEKCGFTSEPRK